MKRTTATPDSQDLEAFNSWGDAQGVQRAEIGFDYVDPETGTRKAVFDLAWREGLQPGLSGPVAVLVNGPSATLAMASAAGHRCFTSLDEAKTYIRTAAA